MSSISRQSRIPIPKKIITFFFALGLVPWYSFEEGRLVHKKIFKCYASALALLLTCLSLGFLVARCNIFYEDIVSVKAILEIINELGALATVVVAILGAAFWNMSTWEELYKQYIFVNNLMRQLLPPRPLDSVFVVKYAKVILFLEFANLISFWYVSYTFFQNGIDIISYYSVSRTIGYLGFLVSFVANFAASLNKYIYQNMNNSFKVYTIQNIRLDKSIQKIKELYLELDKTLQMFNKLLGWPLLLLYCNVVTYVLGTLEHIIIAIFHKNLVLAYLLPAVQSMVSTIAFFH